VSTGGPEFIYEIMKELGLQEIHGESFEILEAYALKKSPVTYKANFIGKMACLRVNNRV